MRDPRAAVVRADVEEFELALADLPASYEGCPIVAEGKRLKRYRK